MNSVVRFLTTAALAGVASSVVPGPAVAQANLGRKDISQGEFAVLPAWCIDSQAGPYGGPEGGSGLNRSPRASQWVGAMGTDFWHMHHYCYAMRDLMRLPSAIDPATRTYLIGRAILDLGYVIANCQPTMPLMPEVFLRLGELHLMRDELDQAAAAFEQSRALKPDYWPAYDRWIVVLMRLKQLDVARNLAEEGLRHAPNEPNLTARLASINSVSRSTPHRGKPKAAAAAPAASSVL